MIQSFRKQERQLEFQKCKKKKIDEKMQKYHNNLAHEQINVVCIELFTIDKGYWTEKNML